MTFTPRPHAGGDGDHITARDFNQQVSRARRVATDGPVFITERGWPRHVLMSIEAYKVLLGDQMSIVDLLHLKDDVDPDVDMLFALSPEERG